MLGFLIYFFRRPFFFSPHSRSPVILASTSSFLFSPRHSCGGRNPADNKKREKKPLPCTKYVCRYVWYRFRCMQIGCGTRIRTWINGFKGHCPAFRRSRNDNHHILKKALKRRTFGSEYYRIYTIKSMYFVFNVPRIFPDKLPHEAAVSHLQIPSDRDTRRDNIKNDNRPKLASEYEYDVLMEIPSDIHNISGKEIRNVRLKEINKRDKQ